jgi:hypothetical protein
LSAQAGSSRGTGGGSQKMASADFCHDVPSLLKAW